MWAPKDSAFSVSGFNSDAKPTVTFICLCPAKQYLIFWHSCSFSGCVREFPSHGKLKHHEKVHEGQFITRMSFFPRSPSFNELDFIWEVCLCAAGYPCETEGCPFQGKTWTEYLKHRREHKGLNAILLSVEHHFCCIAHLVAHKLSHKCISQCLSVKVPCGQCKKQFNNTWFLHQHELHVHSGEKRMLLCPKKGCDKKFTRRFNLESHVLGDHEGKRPFSCAYPGCGKSFAMKVNSLLQNIGISHLCNQYNSSELFAVLGENEKRHGSRALWLHFPHTAVNLFHIAIFL